MVKHTKGWEYGNFLTVKSMQSSEGKEARDWQWPRGVMQKSPLDTRTVVSGMYVAFVDYAQK